MVTHPRCRVRGRHLERGHAGPVPEALRSELRGRDRADSRDQRPGAEVAADPLAARAAHEAADLVAEARQLELLQLGIPGLLVFLLRDRDQPLERAAILRHARDRMCELEHFLRVDRTGRSLGAELDAGGAAALDAEVDADQVAPICDPHPLERRLEPPGVGGGVGVERLDERCLVAGELLGCRRDLAQLVERVWLERLLTHADSPRCRHRARRSSRWSRSVSRRAPVFWRRVGQAKLFLGIGRDDTRKGESLAPATLPSRRAPVAQWIEQWFPKPRAQVRFLPGASIAACQGC